MGSRAAKASGALRAAAQGRASPEPGPSVDIVRAGTAPAPLNFGNQVGSNLYAIDLWKINNLLLGRDLNGQLDVAPGPLESIIGHLASHKEAAHRQAAFDGFMCGREDRDKLIEALSRINPDDPMPDPPVRSRPANLGDVRRIMAESQWIWNGYIPQSRLSGIAAYEGVGKTRFAMDLAKRIHNRIEFPDGQPPVFPEGTPTIWVCSDGQQDDLVTIAEAMGLPDEAIVFNTTPEDPYGGTELDAEEDRNRLEGFIRDIKPGLVFIDTLTNATNFDLCRATENKAMTGPLRDIAQRTQTAIIPLLHLSKDGHALGRRIKGVTRTIIQLDAADPDQPSRLRLFVSKSFAKKPPDLGVTMGDSGNTYDFNPPTAPEVSKGGRPAAERSGAKAFIVEALTREDGQIATQMAAEFENAGKGSTSTFWRAVEEMEGKGELSKEGGRGKGKQVTLYLKNTGPERGPNEPF